MNQQLAFALRQFDQEKDGMDPIQRFLSASTFAVAGVSIQRHKYGNQVFRALLASGRDVYALNPSRQRVEGHQHFRTLADLPSIPEALSIITPPEITRKIVDDAIGVGIRNIWMQPGAEDKTASAKARDAGINVIDDGSCLLVLLSRD